jgi:hypothetical protein
MTPEADAEKTVLMVPLTELLELARLGHEMRRAQRLYWRRRRELPHAPADTELRAAKNAEDKFDAAVSSALARQRQTIPGMEAAGEEGGEPR